MQTFVNTQVRRWSRDMRINTELKDKEHSLSGGVGTCSYLLCAGVISDQIWSDTMKPSTLTQHSFLKSGFSIQKKICQLCSWTRLSTTGIQCHALGYNGDASSVAELLPLVSCLGIEPRYLTIHLPAVFILDSYFHYVLFGQGIHEPNGPTQEYFRLERLVDMVVSPYLSNYLYMSPSDSSSGAHSFYALPSSCWNFCFVGQWCDALFYCLDLLIYSKMH